MSYKKMMKQIHKNRKQINMGFSTIEINERRKSPILSISRLEKIWALSEEEQRIEYAKIQEDWNKETTRLLKQNPKLGVID